MNIKTFSRRDSATAALRKLGIQARDYDLFIVKHEVDFSVNIEKAKAHLNSLKNPAKPEPSPMDIFKMVPAAPIKQTRKVRRTVSSVCRELILAGKSNEEVFAAIAAEFRTDVRAKHYPGWYRAELKRNGKI